MADCPKCHFTQPDDQYCANCGVDMRAYKPAPEPLLVRLSQNTTAQVILVLLIVGALFSGIYVSQKDAIDRRLRQALKSNSNQSLEQDEDDAEIVEEVAKSQVETAKPMTLSAAEVEESFVPTPTVATSPISEIEIAYAEVPMPLIQIWANEGQVLSEDSQTRSILVTQEGQLSAMRRQDWAPFFLPGGATRGINTTEPQMEKFPAFESDIGMALDFQFQSLTPEKINFTVEAILSLPAELDESVNTSTITGTYEIPRGGILVIVGLVPQTSIRGEAADSLNGTPLNVMQSPEFLAGASEFALIIRPQ